MVELRVFSKREGDCAQWHEQDALFGEQEVMTVIREAERIFADARTKRATAFRVEHGKSVERIERFDQEARQIILMSKVVGG